MKCLQHPVGIAMRMIFILTDENILAEATSKNCLDNTSEKI